jgi:hypothetical protein
MGISILLYRITECHSLLGPLLVEIQRKTQVQVTWPTFQGFLAQNTIQLHLRKSQNMNPSHPQKLSQIILEDYSDRQNEL